MCVGLLLWRRFQKCAGAKAAVERRRSVNEAGQFLYPKSAGGLLTDPETAEAAGQFQAMLMSSPSTRIAGGTDEILRNIIAERVLGLPGDIRVDKDVPFNQIPTKGRK